MQTIPIFLLITLANGEEEDEWLPKSVKNKNKFDSIGPPPNPVAVYLGPYVFDGLSDPATGLKTPVDFLEFAMVHPKNEEERRHYLKTRKLSDLQFIVSPTAPPLFYNPRDKLLERIKNGTKGKDDPMWIDFAKLQSKNLDIRSKPKGVHSKYLDSLKIVKKVMSGKEQEDVAYFDPESFQLDNTQRKIDWTTCEEFKKKSVFHPKDVIDAEWIPFYVWSTIADYSAIVHKFSVPSRKVVQRYRKTYGPYLGVNVDWNQPKLLLEEADELLLIAADQRGLFYAIKAQEVSHYLKTHPEVKYPVITLRMKILDPYLALMYCDDYYATLMALKNEEPKTNKDKYDESRELNFTGIGYPVSLDLEGQIERAKSLKVFKERQEQSKYIQLRDEDYVVPKDRYIDRYI